MNSDATGDRPAFGPYEIQEPLGRGGGGEVYRAWDPRLQRVVALKILRGLSETNPDRVRQFIAEARAASVLNHPNIVTVFDAAVDGATPYIISELIDGESLASELRRGPIPLKRLLDLATQIADGLSEAHGAGIVHCDLKPENIMVTRAGRAKILDFGLVRPAGFQDSGGIPAAADSETVIVPGLLAGTVPYMSPEQARGAAVDYRSDQFSFGLILYEMATGRPAFRRDTPAETLEAIGGDEPPPLTTVNPQAPLLLWWIVERCLAKHPRDRYDATADLLRDLRMLRDRLPEAIARERPPSQRAGGAVRRRIPVAIALVALAGAALTLWRLPEPGPDLTALRFTPFATDEGYQGFPAWAPDGQTIAYAAEREGVLQILTRRRNAPTATLITESTHDCKYPFWSPDGRRVYYVSAARDREGIWSVPAAGGESQLIVQDASAGAISPDGRMLAFLRDDERADIVGTAALWFTSVDASTEPTRYTRPPFDELRLTEAIVSFSPDGRTLALSAVPGTIGLPPEKRGWQLWLLPMPDGLPLRRLQWLPDTAPRTAGLTWLPDSRHVVLGTISTTMPGSHLWMADLKRDRAWPLARGTTSASYPSASPSGDEIAFTADEPQYDLLEVPLDGGPARNLLATSRNETDPVWSQAANAYVYISDRNGQDEVWLRTGIGPFGEQPVVTQAQFKDDRTIMLSSPAFSPDGRRLAYQRNAGRPVWPLRIWYSPVENGTPVPLLPEAHEGYQGAPTWSPDGRWIAFAEWDSREWRLLKVRVGGEGADASPIVLRRDGVGNAAPRWSPADESITWETEEGLLIVAASDGRTRKNLSTGQWLVHTWSQDGSVVYGIRQDDDLQLVLASLDVGTGRERILSSLGPAPPVNDPIRGITLGPGGRTLVTSRVRMQGDLWVLAGFKPPEGLLRRLF